MCEVGIKSLVQGLACRVSVKLVLGLKGPVQHTIIMLYFEFEILLPSDVIKVLGSRTVLWILQCSGLTCYADHLQILGFYIWLKVPTIKL